MSKNFLGKNVHISCFENTYSVRGESTCLITADSKIGTKSMIG